MLSIDCYNGVTIGHGKVSIFGMLPFEIFIYYIEGLLIDTGPHRLEKDICAFLRNRPLKQIIITHIHEDHCGLGARIQSKHPSVPIYLHPIAFETALDPPPLPLYRRLLFRKRNSFKPEFCPATVETDSYSFTVIHVGSHSRDHIVLYEPRLGWLFTGDILATVRPRLGFMEENYTEHIESLQKLLNLEPRVLFCAHSGVHTDAEIILRERLAYLLRLRDQVIKLRAQGLSDKQIAKILFPKVPILAYLSKGELSPYHIIRSL